MFHSALIFHATELTVHDGAVLCVWLWDLGTGRRQSCPVTMAHQNQICCPPFLCASKSELMSSFVFERSCAARSEGSVYVNNYPPFSHSVDQGTISDLGGRVGEKRPSAV